MRKWQKPLASLQAGLRIRTAKEPASARRPTMTRNSARLSLLVTEAFSQPVIRTVDDLFIGTKDYSDLWTVNVPVSP